eukprot:NODE_2042_length_520_cov_121.994962_g2027_i0.p1 GENE.NODE_2042_length_520_cov_121.994962_g2027_i0~~NODE_2042_length_520_cov_121.994962_g2027_i0.p1  ORF type:complete len:121 (+),score=37.79 NODE_2042_length_520_cov_121.994962_g2027_i0:51-365(+)
MDECFVGKAGKHFPGSLSMAKKNSVPLAAAGNGAQFFISTGEANKIDHLNGKYVVCGMVEQGMDIVRQIEAVRVRTTSNAPVEPVTIEDCGQLGSNKTLALPNA